MQFLIMPRICTGTSCRFCKKPIVTRPKPLKGEIPHATARHSGVNMAGGRVLIYNALAYPPVLRIGSLWGMVGFYPPPVGGTFVMQLQIFADRGASEIVMLQLPTCFR